MAVERTLSIIKPDSVEKGVIGQVLARFEREGLKPVAMKMKHLTRREAEGFYAEHQGKPFYADLVEFMASGPVVLMELEGEGAILANRRVMGATNPEKADPDTLRKLFGADTRHNAVHGSDSPTSAAREISYFFAQTELCPYEWKR